MVTSFALERWWFVHTDRRNARVLCWAFFLNVVNKRAEYWFIVQQHLFETHCDAFVIMGFLLYIDENYFVSNKLSAISRDAAFCKVALRGEISTLRVSAYPYAS